MATGKSWSYEKDKMLIELVKNKPDLYDLQSPHYSDSNYKKKTWNKIERALELAGAKIRWLSLRAQYRKYVAKLKTKSGQAGSKICKWRYYDQMQFLSESVGRQRISSVIDDEADNENINDANNEESDVRTISSRQTNDNEVELVNDSVNTFANNTPMTQKTKNKQCNIQQENASATVMKYILEKSSEVHPVDNFFSLMAATVKTFSDFDQHLVKKRVFTLVSQIEEKYLVATSSPACVHQSQVSPVPSSQSTSSSNCFDTN